MNNKGSRRILLWFYTVPSRFRYKIHGDSWWQGKGESGFITVQHNTFAGLWGSHNGLTRCGVSTSVHGSIWIPIVFTFQLRSHKGTYNYTIRTQPSISITSSFFISLQLSSNCNITFAFCLSRWNCRLRRCSFCRGFKASLRLTATWCEQLRRLQMTTSEQIFNLYISSPLWNRRKLCSGC